MISIEIARRHYLLYLLLPHWAKVALLSLAAVLAVEARRSAHVAP
jgi:hypothetical protein